MRFLIRGPYAEFLVRGLMRASWSRALQMVLGQEPFSGFLGMGLKLVLLVRRWPYTGFLIRGPYTGLLDRGP